MCRVMTAHPKVIGICSKPYMMSFYTISFRSFSPTPGGLEFQPGKDYYFMTTSSKEDLHLRSGGMCRTHNMKVVFKVADSTQNKKLNSVTPVPAPPGVKPLQQDNQLYTASPPSLQNEVSDDLEERRRRRKKEKKERRRNKKQKSAASSSQITTVIPYLNDNPKFRQKEPSEVERVNNYMAKTDSMFVGGISACRRVEVTSFITSIFIILLFMAL